MRHSESISQIAPALVKALAEIGGVSKGGTNPHFKSKYATLESVIDASKGILASHGIALMQFPGAFGNGAMSLDTVLIHESGEWVSGIEAFGVATGKQDPQAVGSALTYARRYAQMAVLNMPAVDDDGEAATRSAPVKKQEDTHGPDWPDLVNPSTITSNAAKKDEALVEASRDVKSRLDFASTVPALEELIREVTPTVAKFPETWRRVLWGEYSAILAELKEAA